MDIALATRFKAYKEAQNVALMGRLPTHIHNNPVSRSFLLATIKYLSWVCGSFSCKLHSSHGQLLLI